jgi:Cu-Zn family superoxide dismutase
MKQIGILSLALLATTACATAREVADEVGEETRQTAREVRGEVAGGPTATAQLRNAQGQVVGTATLEQEEDGVDIELHVTGLPPGVHGFHIHETGTCTPPDFTSAGGHYNPTNRQHGFEDPQGPHAGDMRNIQVGANGMAHVEVENERVTISPGPTTLFDADGSAIVIHAGADDYRTNPAGEAGARIACGVVTR